MKLKFLNGKHNIHIIAEVQSLYNAFYDERITSNKEMENLQTTIDVNIYNDIFNCNEDYSNITITS